MKSRKQLCYTEHAKLRIKERMGVEGKKQLKDLTSNAFHKGLSPKKHTIQTDLYNWADYKVGKYFGRASQWRIYKEHLFLFNRNLALVTIIPIPENVKEKMQKRD